VSGCAVVWVWEAAWIIRVIWANAIQVNKKFGCRDRRDEQGEHGGSDGCFAVHRGAAPAKWAVGRGSLSGYYGYYDYT
jgi:hypothetical protein